MHSEPDEAPHNFRLSDVEPDADHTDEGIAITLVDVCGGRVRLHLNVETGELLCERIAAALECRFDT